MAKHKNKPLRPLRDYDKTHPVIGTRVTPEQLQILQELADKVGLTPRQYLRDVIMREHVEGRGIHWPEGYFESGAAKTSWGGKGRGGGRKRIQQDTKDG